MSVSYLILQLLLSTLLFPGSNASSATGNKLKGIVLRQDTKSPVKDAYVYIVPGEEEAFTDGRGMFEISTSQEAPLICNVRHPDFKELKIQVATFEKPLSIWLRAK